MKKVFLIILGLFFAVVCIEVTLQVLSFVNRLAHDSTTLRNKQDFIDKDYQEVNRDVYNSYSLESWIKDLLR